jgi:hypothetical protein
MTMSQRSRNDEGSALTSSVRAREPRDASERKPSLERSSPTSSDDLGRLGLAWAVGPYARRARRPLTS